MPVISEIEHSEVLKVANLLRDGRERVLVQSERLQRLQFSYTINNKSIPKRNRRAEKVGDMQKAGGWGKAHTLARVRTRTNLRRDDLEPIVVAREHADVAQLGDLGRKLGELLARQVEPLNRLRGVSASTCPYGACLERISLLGLLDKLVKRFVLEVDHRRVARLPVLALALSLAHGTCEPTHGALVAQRAERSGRRRRPMWQRRNGHARHAPRFK